MRASNRIVLYGYARIGIASQRRIVSLILGPRQTFDPSGLWVAACDGLEWIKRRALPGRRLGKGEGREYQRHRERRPNR